MLAAFSETTMDNPRKRVMGKMNINSASPGLMRLLFQGEEKLVEEILFLRDSHAEGFLSILDLKTVPGMTNQRRWPCAVL